MIMCWSKKGENRLQKVCCYGEVEGGLVLRCRFTVGYNSKVDYELRISFARVSWLLRMQTLATTCYYSAGKSL